LRTSLDFLTHHQTARRATSPTTCRLSLLTASWSGWTRAGTGTVRKP